MTILIASFPKAKVNYFGEKKQDFWSFLINFYTAIKIVYFSLAELLFPIGWQFSPADLLIPTG
jgi:hypothetical protein